MLRARTSLELGGSAQLRVPAGQGWPTLSQWQLFRCCAVIAGSSELVVHAEDWRPDLVRRKGAASDRSGCVAFTTTSVTLSRADRSSCHAFRGVHNLLVRRAEGGGPSSVLDVAWDESHREFTDGSWEVARFSTPNTGSSQYGRTDHRDRANCSARTRSGAEIIPIARCCRQSTIPLGGSPSRLPQWIIN